MTVRMQSQVQASKMRFLRRIEGVTLFNKVRSSEIRKSLKTLYYSTVGLLKPTLVTNSNYLNLVRNKNLKFPDFSCLFFPIMMKLFLFIQHKGFKRKMGVFDKFFKILPISSFWCKILILRIIFLVEIKRIRVNWCPRLDGLQ